MCCCIQLCLLLTIPTSGFKLVMVVSRHNTNKQVYDSELSLFIASVKCSATRKAVKITTALKYCISNIFP